MGPRVTRNMGTMIFLVGISLLHSSIANVTFPRPTNFLETLNVGLGTTTTASTTTTTTTTASKDQACVSGWSSWINNNTPNNAEELERMTSSELVAFCPGGTITQVDCQTVDGIQHHKSGDNVNCTVSDGLVCHSKFNGVIPCSDYKIKYECTCSDNPEDFSTECSDDSMTIGVVNSTSKVQVYPEGFQSDADCVFTFSPSSGQFSHQFFFNSSNCGASVTWSEDGEKWLYSVAVYLQQLGGMIQRSDTRYVSTCTFNRSHSLSLGLANVNGSQGFQEESDTVSADASKWLTFKIKDDRGVSLTSSDYVILGDNLTLNIQLQDNTVFSDLFVKDCRISNKADPATDNYTSLSLVNADGCIPDGDVKTVLAGNPVYTSNHSGYEVTVTAFMFTAGRTGNTNTLFFTCGASLCRTSDESPCNAGCLSSGTVPPSTDEGAAAHTSTTSRPERIVRRRRAERDEFTVHGEVRVLLSEDALHHGQTPQKETGGEDSKGTLLNDPDNCLRHPRIQTFFVAMGIVLIALLLAVIALSILLCRRRQRKQAKE